jgi:aryl-alcohol dehydrogenase-like predicted oxidoreductase
VAIAWTLRDARVTSALIGASSFEQLDRNVGALAGLDFSGEELAANRSPRGRVRGQPSGRRRAASE